jgi:hypothetical protein
MSRTWFTNPWNFDRVPSNFFGRLILGFLYFAAPPSRFWLEQLFPWNSNDIGSSIATCCVSWGSSARGLVPIHEAKFSKAPVVAVNASIAFKTSSSFDSCESAILISWTPDILVKTVKLESVANTKDQNKNNISLEEGNPQPLKCQHIFK